MSQLSVLKQIEKQVVEKEAQSVDWPRVERFLSSGTPEARTAYQRYREEVLAEYDNPPPRIAPAPGPESGVQKRRREVQEEVEEKAGVVMKRFACSKEKAIAAILNADHELYSRYRAAAMGVKE